MNFSQIDDSLCDFCIRFFLHLRFFPHLRFFDHLSFFTQLPFLRAFENTYAVFRSSFNIYFRKYILEMNLV
jgi:hypothetical protein